MNLGRSFYEVHAWVIEQLRNIPHSGRPLFIGVNGPQGSGKSTLTKILVQVLGNPGQGPGIRSIAISVDDFYLTRQEQVRLASQYPDNALLQQRGYPGTHDVELGVKTLQALKDLKLSQTLAIPAYDKSKNQGQGDRLPERDWPQVCGPLDLVFFEGWMLGFTSVSNSELLSHFELSKNSRLAQSFQEVNRFLDSYQPWVDFLDAFIQLDPQEVQYVVDWRIEAEEKMKAQGRAGMSREEIASYIQKFLLAYEVYLPQLRKRELLPSRTLLVPLSRQRLTLPN